MSRVLKNKNHHITQGYSNQHLAVDLVGEGSSLDDITAHSDGIVNWCQTGYGNKKGSTGNASYGNCVKIKHNNGYETLYAHMSRVYVTNGQHVSKGQAIGYMGNSGNAYGSHLHFEVRKNGTRINPTPYLDTDLPGNGTSNQSQSSVNTGKHLHLPASAQTWRVYPLDKAPVKGNECAFIKPAKFGGLDYDIIRFSQPDVAVIQTRDFGQVQIYVAPSTGATIS